MLRHSDDKGSTFEFTVKLEEEAETLAGFNMGGFGSSGSGN